MIAGAQEKYLVSMDENGNLKIDETQTKLLGLVEATFNWKLVRERDGLTHQSKEIKWIEWNDDDTYKKAHPLPAPNLSLIMSPFNQYFTWQTTNITEIVEMRDDYIKFKTTNSVYELFKLNKL